VPFSGLSSLAWAGEGDGKKLLLIVFQRGGCDGLSLVSPVSDPGYIDARTPEMRIADSGDKAGLVLDTIAGSNVDFRLHPEAHGLHDMFKSKRLAIVHAAGLPNGTRSHFEAQDLIERGVADTRALQSSNMGWLARALPHLGAGGEVAAVSATPGLAHMLQGADHALSMPDLQNGIGLSGGTQTLTALQALYTGYAGDVGAAGVATIDAHGASYDNYGDLARGLQAIARLARMNVGLRVACVDQGGWDTHDNQPGRFNGQVNQLSKNLAAFHDDIAGSGVQVTTVVMTEFGRRLRSNRSNGTDHGYGSVMMVLGDGVAGGKLYGRWPGLAAEQLDRGVDLAVTTDYRAVLGEVLRQQGVAQPAIGGQVFPGFGGGAAVGLMS
jgi:uncharacterized protein (DUF1501 family)